MSAHLFQKIARMAALLLVALGLALAGLSAAYAGHGALAGGDDGPHASRTVLPRV